MMRTSVVLSLCTVAVVTGLFMPEKSHAQASFQGLGDLADGIFHSYAFGVSADGNTVVGYSGSSNGDEAILWAPAQGMIGLGDLPGGGVSSSARGVSADGNIVVGESRSSNGREAFRWDATQGMIGLGDLPGGGRSSSARGVSADGNTIVGFSGSSFDGSSNGTEAFRWDAAQGIIGLGELPGGSVSSQAWGVSADGNIIVGESRSSNGIEAFRWDSTQGMIGLGDLPGTIFYSRAFAVSADGNTVVGESRGTLTGREAFRWDAAQGMIGLGDLPGGGVSSSARGVSADGNTIVGYSGSSNGTEAFLWDVSHGMRSLKEVLEIDHGLDLTGWRLIIASDVSGDSRVIVGFGVNPQGRYEAWRVVLGPPNYGPGVTCPESITAECVDDGANLLVGADVFDADGDPLSVEWKITYPDASVVTITETVMFADPPVPVKIVLVDPLATPLGFVFPHGNSTVELSVSDGIAETKACSPITISIEDTAGPVIVTLMEQIEVGTDLGECYATVDLDSAEYRPVFADLCSPDVTASNNAPATFPLGSTVVTWTFDDGHGNTTTATQTVIVTDTEAPTATPPLDIVIGHDTGGCVATSVNLGLPVTADNCAVVGITNNAPELFPLGETEVEWYVSDAAGNTSIVTQLVTVTNANPIADAGSDQQLECNIPAGRVVTLDAAGSSDPDFGDVLSFHWEAVDIVFDDADIATPTATFPRGSTTVQLTVTDQCGAVSMTDLLIIVQDTHAPQIQAVVVDRAVLSTPNHKMIPIFLDMLVSDECNLPGNLLLLCTVESDEPDDETGDGALTGDVNGEDGHTAPVEISLAFNAVSGRWEGIMSLRAERSGGGTGRKYSIRCAAADVSGNVTYATVCVTVPHNQSRGKK